MHKCTTELANCTTFIILDKFGVCIKIGFGRVEK